jgi:3-hydroxyacyl-CoA dehydrogenase / enoyl-CoA hydratase / 3-hydroxybutyryl-CoA epimerase
MPLFKAENLEVDTDGSGAALLKIDVAGRSMNVLTRQVMEDLDAALDRVAGESGLRVLVIRGMKKTGFLAGADIQQFAEIASAEEASALSKRGQDLFNKLELLPIPTVAVIHGPCLGGGLELALACDYRLVVDGPGTQIGLPEVELGLLPGWGGTQRLPRVIGLEPALSMILAARRLKAREALKVGLADASARTEPELRSKLDGLLEKAKAGGKRRKTSLPLRNWRQRFLESTGITRGLIFRMTRRRLKRRVPDDMPGPWEALEAVRVGLKEGMTAGLAFERQAAGRLATSNACRNLVNLFLQREKARRAPEKVEGVLEVRRVGVVGAGTMGAGIAQMAALRNCEVVVQEVNAEALGNGILRIRDLFNKAVERGVIAPDVAAARLNAIKGTVAWEGFGDLDLVVEAALENLEVKKNLFRELEQHTRPGTVLATNTSSLPVTALQEGAQHPERIGGLHFFNPVHRMDLIEVVRAPATSDQTIDLLTRFALALGKTPIRVKDSPGFVVNRVLMPYVNEAVLIVAEGLGIDDVDRTMRKFGMPMGPLEMLDQVGLDVAAHIADSMQPLLGAAYTPNPAFRRMSESGWLGQKKGAGFYYHRGGKNARANKDALPLIQSEPPAHAGALAPLPGTVRLQQARDRMVLLMVNEAAVCLGAGLAEDAQATDLAVILGTGWAPHRGGPLHYADAYGVSRAVETLSGFARQFGPRYEPCEELRQRAAENRPFYRAGI